MLPVDAAVPGNLFTIAVTHNGADTRVSVCSTIDTMTTANALMPKGVCCVQNQSDLTIGDISGWQKASVRGAQPKKEKALIRPFFLEKSQHNCNEQQSSTAARTHINGMT